MVVCYPIHEWSSFFLSDWPSVFNAFSTPPRDSRCERADLPFARKCTAYYNLATYTRIHTHALALRARRRTNWMSRASPRPPFYCYVLQSVDSRKTYIGSTTDVTRRLLEHNGAGVRGRGARATRGEMWDVAAYVSGFSTWSRCLSFEYTWRRARARRRRTGGSAHDESPIERRWSALRRFLAVGTPRKKWFGDRLTLHCLSPDARLAWPLSRGETGNDENEGQGEGGAQGVLFDVTHAT